MMTHLWLLPWIALAAGAAACLLGALAARSAPTAPVLPPLPRAFLIVWLAAAFLIAFAVLRLGREGVDFVTARGMALGALTGAGLFGFSRWSSERNQAPLLFGFATAMVALGRLWLTHGALSGLTALSVGAALAVLCLQVAPAWLRPAEDREADNAAVGGLLFTVCLAGATAIGFLRAASLGQEFWIDIPLLLGACLALGTLPGRVLYGIVPLLAALLVVVLPLARIAPSWRPAELLLLGAVLFGLLAWLKPGAVEAEEDRVGPAAGFVMLAAGAALAFALWSGYGLALLVLGGWLLAGTRLLTASGGGAARAGMGFAAILLVYRLATLQNSSAVHASGPGDIWDLFAVSLGALLPLLAAEWTRADGLAGRMPPWAVLTQGLLTLMIPALLLDFIWQPRSVAGVLLGAALGLLLAGANGAAKARTDTLAVCAVLFSLLLFQFLPLLQHLNEPTRTVRVGLVLLGAALLALRLLVVRSGSAPKEERNGLAV